MRTPLNTVKPALRLRHFPPFPYGARHGRPRACRRGFMTPAGLVFRANRISRRASARRRSQSLLQPQLNQVPDRLSLRLDPPLKAEILNGSSQRWLHRDELFHGENGRSGHFINIVAIGTIDQKANNLYR